MSSQKNKTIFNELFKKKHEINHKNQKQNNFLLIDSMRNNNKKKSNADFFLEMNSLTNSISQSKISTRNICLNNKIKTNTIEKKNINKNELEYVKDYIFKNFDEKFLDKADNKIIFSIRKDISKDKKTYFLDKVKNSNRNVTERSKSSQKKINPLPLKNFKNSNINSQRENNILFNQKTSNYILSNNRSLEEINQNKFLSNKIYGNDQKSEMINNFDKIFHTDVDTNDYYNENPRVFNEKILKNYNKNITPVNNNSKWQTMWETSNSNDKREISYLNSQKNDNNFDINFKNSNPHLILSDKEFNDYLFTESSPILNTNDSKSKFFAEFKIRKPDSHLDSLNFEKENINFGRIKKPIMNKITANFNEFNNKLQNIENEINFDVAKDKNKYKEFFYSPPGETGQIQGEKTFQNLLEKYKTHTKLSGKLPFSENINDEEIFKFEDNFDTNSNLFNKSSNFNLSKSSKNFIMNSNNNLKSNQNLKDYKINTQKIEKNPMGNDEASIKVFSDKSKISNNEDEMFAILDENLNIVENNIKEKNKLLRLNELAKKLDKNDKNSKTNHSEFTISQSHNMINSLSNKRTFLDKDNQKINKINGEKSENKFKTEIDDKILKMKEDEQDKIIFFPYPSYLEKIEQNKIVESNLKNEDIMRKFNSDSYLEDKKNNEKSHMDELQIDIIYSSKTFINEKEKIFYLERKILELSKQNKEIKQINKQLFDIIENNYKSNSNPEVKSENEIKLEKLYIQYKESSNNLAEEVIILRNQLDKYLHFKK